LACRRVQSPRLVYYLSLTEWRVGIQKEEAADELKKE